jgi:formylglycine-generating enzyme required for sulfatase activity
MLADLLMDANTQQFKAIQPTLAAHSENAVVELENELAKVVHPEWPSLRREVCRLRIPEELQVEIQDASGVVRNGFAFCQRIRHDQLSRILILFDRYGFRPLSIRPFKEGESIQVAVTWTRDGGLWKWIGDAESETLLSRDRELIQEGYVPIDVSVVETRGGPRFAAIWEKQEPPHSSCQQIIIQTLEPGLNESTDQEDKNPHCTSFSLGMDDLGQYIGVGIWVDRQEQNTSLSRMFQGLLEDFREDDFPGLLLQDAHLYASYNGNEQRDELQISALLNVSAMYESRVLQGMSPEEQVESCERLIAGGFRPRVISVVTSPLSGSQTTISVWYRKVLSETAKDRLAKRQANAAIALLQVKRSVHVWPILKHRADPRTRSYLVHRFSPLEISPAIVADELERQTDCSTRRALILILGEYSEQQLVSLDKAKWTSRLLDHYANDPDPGIHGAIAWTLRQWGLHSELKRVEQRLSTGKLEGNRNWYLTQAGKTLSIIPRPGETVIGSPPWEADREGGPEGGVEMQRCVSIDHAFAIMCHQVTVDDFLRFAGKDFFYRKYFSPEPDCPINTVTWYDSVAYCNWLNEQEGIPREEWCYLPNQNGEYANGMTIVPDSLRRNGYRLPTEAEWEFACRSGAITSRYFGQSFDLVNQYSCNVMNSLGRRTALVGSFKPNEFGLFDMLGNTLEWTHSLFQDHSVLINAPLRIGPSETEVVNDRQKRPLRGATLAHPPETVRNAFVDAYPPNGGVYGVGLRLIRTLAMDQQTEQCLVMGNDQRMVLRGTGCMSPAALTRSSYRIMQKPHFPLFAWGFRPARTIDHSPKS